MNVRGARALVGATWSMWLAQRSFFFLLAFGWMIPPLVYLLVWSTAAGGQPVGGWTRGQFVGYYLVLIVVNQLTYSVNNWTVGDSIREGRMSSLLLRPLSPLWDALASDIAGKVVFMAFVIPAGLVLGALLRPELALTPRSCLLFIPALILAWLLRFFWGYWLALLAFWATRADALLAVQDSLVFLLAGQVAPVALLPGPLRTAATILPFRSMVGFPVEVLTGTLSDAQLLSGFMWQLGWLAVTLALWSIVWRSGIRHYEAVGG